MKLRTSFVSNSSSSSFILSIKDENEKISYVIDLNDYIDYKIKDLKSLKEYFMEDYCYENDDDLEKDETYIACRKEINEGNILVVGEADNESEPIKSYILYNGLENNLVESKIIKDIDF